MSTILSPVPDSPVKHHLTKLNHRVNSQRQTTIDEISRFLHIIWLFTESDFKTVLAPSILFALSNGVALSLLLPASIVFPTPFEVLARMPLATLYVWVNLVFFCVQNQRTPDSVDEDAINKPSRPIASGLVSPAEAGNLLVAFVIIALLLAHALGATLPTVLLLAFSYLYNEMRGGEHPLFKSLLNACGIPCFFVGALQVAVGSPTVGTASVATLLGRWVAVLAALVCTTIHIQDIKDLPGDAARGRRTLPIVLGQTAARWLVAVPVLIWSVALPLLWGFDVASPASMLGCAPLAGLAVIVAVRTLRHNTVKEDKRTFKVYCLWLVAVYCLPLSRAVFGGESLWLVMA